MKVLWHPVSYVIPFYYSVSLILLATTLSSLIINYGSAKDGALIVLQINSKITNYRQQLGIFMHLGWKCESISPLDLFQVGHGVFNE